MSKCQAAHDQGPNQDIMPAEENGDSGVPTVPAASAAMGKERRYDLPAQHMWINVEFLIAKYVYFLCLRHVLAFFR